MAVLVNWGMRGRVCRVCRVNGVRGGEEGVYIERILNLALRNSTKRQDRPLTHDSIFYQQPVHWTAL